MPSKRLGTLRYEEKWILGPTQGRSLYIWFCFLYFTNLSLLSFSLPLTRIFIFLLYLPKDYLHPKPGGLRLHFLGLLSHPEHTSKFLPCNLSCATTVHGHFSLMRSDE